MNRDTLLSDRAEMKALAAELLLVEVFWLLGEVAV